MTTCAPGTAAMLAGREGCAGRGQSRISRQGRRLRMCPLRCVSVGRCGAWRDDLQF